MGATPDSPVLRDFPQAGNVAHSPADLRFEIIPAAGDNPKTGRELALRSPGGRQALARPILGSRDGEAIGTAVADFGLRGPADPDRAGAGELRSSSCVFWQRRHPPAPAAEEMPDSFSRLFSRFGRCRFHGIGGLLGFPLRAFRVGGSGSVSLRTTCREGGAAWLPRAKNAFDAHSPS